jgi:putative DNA primase/helicase
MRQAGSVRSVQLRVAKSGKLRRTLPGESRLAARVMRRSQEEIAHALSFVPANDRDTWIAMGMAVKAELGEAGFDIWNNWSQGDDSYKEKDAKAAWRSIRANGAKGIGSLFYEAMQHGFKFNGHGKPYDAAEMERLRVERELRMHQEEAARAERQEKAAKLAEEIYNAAKPAQSHPYLEKKGVKGAPGVRVGRWYQEGDDLKRYREKENCLLIPIRDETGKLWNLQAIFPEPDAELERDKDYLNGGRKRGCYFSTGKPQGVVIVAEGYATAMSVHMATGHAVCVAFDKGSLVPVMSALRVKMPDAKLIAAADNDIREGKPNGGLEKACEAAAEVGGLVAVPTKLDGVKDFNDLHQIKGTEAVKAAIEGALPAAPKEQKQDGTMHAAAALRTVANKADVDGWPEPEKLPELPEVPPFDFAYLPGTLRAFVEDVSERMQAPPEFAAVAAMVMTGSAIGRNVGIRPKQADSWTVIPNIWGMLIGKSGIMKSPAQGEALAPLKRMQALAFEKYEEERAEYEMNERAEKIRAAAAEAAARKALAKDKTADVVGLIKPSQELVEPKPRRYIVNDSSPEALCETLRDNPQGVLCERDELIGLLRSMDREGNQEARALYLTAADGDKPFTVDRIMRGSGRHIEALCVSMIGGIQPGVLAGYVRETQRSGSGDDGLLQRFSLMVYPDIKGDWRNVDRKPNAEAREAMRLLIERLCTLTPESAGAEVDPYGGVPFVRFDSAAYALFVEWLTDHERKLRHGDDHPAVASHLSKYRKLVPALALINHLCEGGRGSVTETAISRALLFSDFLEEHARRVYSYASRPDFDAAKTILAKLRSGKLPVEFSSRDVYRPGWSGLTTADEAMAAIRVLLDFKHIREKPQEPHEVGRPSRVYQAHPSTKAAS